MKSNNSALNRVLVGAAQDQRSTGYGYPSQGYQGYPAPGHGQTPGFEERSTRAMTLDDVVVRTITLIAITGAVGAASWLLLPDNGLLTAVAWFGSAIAGVVLALVIIFRRVTNPAVIMAYAALQGVALGLVSRLFESYYGGIVAQAVVGTFGVFFGMAALYKFRVLRATPRFARWVTGALVGVVALMLANWIVALIGHGNGFGLRAGVTGQVGALPIIFSLVVIGVGALTFILDFDQIERAMKAGLPERYAWACAFGLLVGLIFLYYEILRLLSYLRR